MLFKRAVVHMQAVQFYKAWDEYGALSNFSCHAITMPEGPLTDTNTLREASSPHDQREWRSVEHFYQAQKFATTSSELQALLCCFVVTVYCTRNRLTCISICKLPYIYIYIYWLSWEVY